MKKTYTLKQKDAFTWQIKEGRRVIEKIFTSSLGYHIAFRTCDSLDRAIEIFKESRSQFSEAFTGEKLEIDIVIQ